MAPTAPTRRTRGVVTRASSATAGSGSVRCSSTSMHVVSGTAPSRSGSMPASATTACSPLDRGRGRNGSCRRDTRCRRRSCLRGRMRSSARPFADADVGQRRARRRHASISLAQPVAQPAAKSRCTTGLPVEYFLASCPAACSGAPGASPSGRRVGPRSTRVLRHRGDASGRPAALEPMGPGRADQDELGGDRHESLPDRGAEHHARTQRTRAARRAAPPRECRRRKGRAPRRSRSTTRSRTRRPRRRRGDGRAAAR